MPRFAALSAVFPLAACAMPQGEFPSLAMRPIESRGDAVETPAPAVTAPHQAAATQARALGAEVTAAARAFDAALPQVRAAAGRAGAAGGESWIAAQLALTRLDQARARTVTALGTLDRLLVAEYGANRPVASETAALAETARTQADAQGETIAALKARIAPAD